MKTKEEILNNIIGEIRAENKAEIWYDDAIKAMEEYAKQQVKNCNIPPVIDTVCEHKDSQTVECEVYLCNDCGVLWTD
ncbi:MAG: hypothetical protein DRJ01_09725 [Bacteroidetes bacterium]|nr:MAG: hypothetical protein DRJ01_09725 [Bacteroidota bacterium]